MSKFKSFMEKFKKQIWIYLIVWLVIAILFIAPLACTVADGAEKGIPWLQAVSAEYGNNVLKFPIIHVFESKYVNDFVNLMKYYTIFYFGMVIFAITKTLPKSDFEDIEHGSSDWCRPGEQYKILSKNKGLILAKDNYLPADKPGNVNVLIVGRIWCW